MLRLRLGQAAICSGLPILAHQAHSANMGTKSRDYIYGARSAPPKWTAPSREQRAAAPSVSLRKERNSASLISPEAMANSRWLPAGHRMPPNPHIVGRVEESRIDTRPWPMNPLQEFAVPAIATPHPVIPKNPDVAQTFVRGVAGTGGMTSSSGSTADVRITSISPVEKPVRVRSISTSIEPSSPSSSCRISRSQPALSAILLSAIRNARFWVSERPDRVPQRV